MPPNLLKRFFAHHKMKVVIRMTIGWAFIVFGILGLFLPILQGILFLAVGVALLADHIPIFMKIKMAIYHKFPKLESMVHREHERIHKFGERLKNGEMNSALKWIAITIVTLAAIIIPFLIFGKKIDAAIIQLRDGADNSRGIVAAVLGSLLASDILLPIPSSIVSTSCGLLLGLFTGTLVSLAGMTCSCIAGYFMAAKLGEPFVAKMVGSESMQHFKKLQQKHGNMVVIITRPVPVLAEIAVLSAGLGQIPFGRFLLLSTLSNLGISAVYAAIGAYSANLNAFMLAVAGSMILPGIGMLWLRFKRT
jgi:uncharacterized membrane protein YdjX (TVP38/TMEM64 family)